MTQNVPDPISFDQSGPFYKMISAFVSAVAGIEAVAVPNNPMKYYKGQPGIGMEGKVHTKFVIDTFDLHQRYIKGNLTTHYMVASLCQMLVNTAYESVKGQNDHSPEFEFFRHIRNACSHNNTFNFMNGEPRRRAEWRGLVIDDSQKNQSNPLFGQQAFLNILGPADSILLLWDIEQKLI